ncbi:PepSY domain-containing protein [Rheinheimera sp.]|uniref:PepSY domain-containing protein n=1 Tax=Rheinheimera sp. TaxID=1869214 RepID=UPI00307DF5FB
MWRKLHTWGGVILTLPMIIIGISTIFIAHADLFGTKDIKFGAIHPEQESKRLVVQANQVIVGGKQGLVQLDANWQLNSHQLSGFDVKNLRLLDDTLYATGKKGVFRQQADQQWQQVYQADSEDVALLNNQLLVLDKKQGLMLQQADQSWLLVKAYGKDEGPYDLKKLMMDLHTGEALFGEYDWLWMDILGLYILIFSVSGIWLWSRRSSS